LTISATTGNEVGTRLNEAIGKLDLQWRFKQSQMVGVGFAARNVWSRAARRRMSKSHEQDSDKMDEDTDDEPALGFRVQVIHADRYKSDVDVMVRWLQGSDSVLFESFCGMLKRRVDS
jgi:23S rRNA (adenine1618-N6)-methyltransferase